MGHVLEVEDVVAQQPEHKDRHQTNESMLAFLWRDGATRIDAVGDVIEEEFARQIDGHRETVDDLHAAETERHSGEDREEIADLGRMDEFEEDDEGDLVVELDHLGQIVWRDVALIDKLFVGLQEGCELLGLFFEQRL